MVVNPNVKITLQRVKEALRPEDIFGVLGGTPDEQLETARSTYRRLARQIHPDIVPDHLDDAATEATATLNRLWQLAQARIQAGTYGKATSNAVVITTRQRTYTIGEPLAKGDIANLYHCAFAVDGRDVQGIFKVSRNPADKDLIENEADMLEHLAGGADYPQFAPYFPHLVENVVYRDASAAGKRRANILCWTEEIASPASLYTLVEVREHYQDGIDPADMAWMWRRVLVALGYAHQQGVVHGAVLPTHLLIEPDMHGLVLIDWSYAVQTASGKPISAISNPYEKWYPPEIFDKQPPLFGHDIYMGAKCMVYLLGGDPLSGDMPAGVPPRMGRYFKWCMQAGGRSRPQDAWKLLEEFDDILESLYGPRRFREFKMPKR